MLTLTPKPECEVVIFEWSRKHGDCYQCGLPAAFVTSDYSEPPFHLCCSVCAANSAADGAAISRIVPFE